MIMENTTQTSIDNDTTTQGMIMENTTQTSIDNDTTTQGPSHANTDKNPENNIYYTILLVTFGLVIYIALYIIRRRNKKKNKEEKEEQYLDHYHSILPQSQIYRGSIKSNLTSMVKSFQSKQPDGLIICENLANIARLEVIIPQLNEINKTPNQSACDQTLQIVNQDHVIHLEKNIELIPKSCESKKQNRIITNWQDKKRKLKNSYPEIPSNSTCEHVQATNQCENYDDYIQGMECEIDQMTQSYEDFNWKHEGIELRQLSFLTHEDDYETNQPTYFDGKSINDDTEFVQKSIPTEIYDSDYKQIETSIQSTNKENSIYTNKDPGTCTRKQYTSDYNENYTSECSTHIAPEVIIKKSYISDEKIPGVTTYDISLDIDTYGINADINTCGISLDIDTDGISLDIDTDGIRLDVDTYSISPDINTLDISPGINNYGIGKDVNTSNSYDIIQDINTYYISPDDDTYDISPEDNTYDISLEDNTSDISPDIHTSDISPDIHTSDISPEDDTYDISPDIHTYDIGPEDNTYDISPDIHTYDIGPDVYTYDTNTSIYTYGSKKRIVDGNSCECPMKTQRNGNDHCVVAHEHHHGNQEHFECKAIIPEDYMAGFWI